MISEMPPTELFESPTIDSLTEEDGLIWDDFDICLARADTDIDRLISSLKFAAAVESASAQYTQL